MNKIDILQILDDIEYRGWSFLVLPMGDGFCLQAAFYAGGALQRGRKWYVSTHATRSEVVQTALKAVLTAEEHEAREHFRYKGKAIFFPHFDVDELVEHRKHAKEDRRAEAAV